MGTKPLRVLIRLESFLRESKDEPSGCVKSRRVFSQWNLHAFAVSIKVIEHDDPGMRGKEACRSDFAFRPHALPASVGV